ncbi:MAG: diguanylate cyclase [Desertifilum sp. SIO1I2]|nr:diguanylate cyclase [Desertifilum sp. SIO1I2]
MISSPENVREQFEALRQAYEQQLPKKVEELEQIWQKLLEVPWDLAEWEIFHCLAHRLVGTSATFGFAGVSEITYTLECCLRDAIATNRIPSAEQKASIKSLLEALKRAAIDPQQDLPNTHLGDRDESVHRNLLWQPDRTIETPHFFSLQEQKKLIFLVEDDPILAQDLALQLSFFSYTVEIFRDLQGLSAAIDQANPAALVMDIILPEGQCAGPELMQAIQRERLTPLPVIFISAREDLTARLQAVRAGGSAYFTKPVDIGGLIDKLDTLTAHKPVEPGRILIVEDESILATYYAAVLQQAGMLTAVVTDPMQVMQPLVEFKPDLILMDMYMPGCSGLELASVIRQQDAYVSIPIVFLSIETNMEQQLAAMHLGGDEFLTKPIEPSHLVAEVKSRVIRSRILSSFMVRDSLTGLFNHTKTKEQLYIEVARARRSSKPLAFAMLDIDHFKSINDAFGHLIGDRVIRSLSRLLQQRLRKTDVIGRYGGEEFAAILPDTSVQAAAKVFDEIRDGFAKVRQQAAEHEFSVTFSCGVAGFPEYGDPNSLNEAADKAMYAAKRGGRNRVKIAQPDEI